jgi:hypothetical protein
MEASTWMGDHQGRPPAPPIRPIWIDYMERQQKCIIIIIILELRINGG